MDNDQPTKIQLLALELELLERDALHLKRLLSRYDRKGMKSAARLIQRNLDDLEQKAADLRARLEAA